MRSILPTDIIHFHQPQKDLVAISRKRGESTPVTAKATVKGIHWRRRLGCRTSVLKVLSVPLEPTLSMSRRDSASRSPGEGDGSAGTMVGRREFYFESYFNLILSPPSDGRKSTASATRNLQ